MVGLLKSMFLLLFNNTNTNTIKRYLKLSDLLLECDKNIGRDSEGDSTYRIHVDIAKRLIQKAYDLGREEGFTEGQNNILESQH